MGLGQEWHLKPFPPEMSLSFLSRSALVTSDSSMSTVDMHTISRIYFGSISLFLLYLGRAEANKYRLKDTFVGDDFFKEWTWETFQDPTHGRVNYVDRNAAIAKNLSFGKCSPPSGSLCRTRSRC